LASGEWWAELHPYRILIGCHFSGARNKNELGDLHATREGIQYKRAKVLIPWRAIQDIEISTQATKRVTAGRVIALGVFALAAKKGETYTYIHISDSNTVWSFADTTSQAKVLAAMKPILDAFNSRVTSAPLAATISGPTPTPAAGSSPSVADELAKLAKLRAEGVLTDEEFAAQKAKLLG